MWVTQYDAIVTTTLATRANDVMSRSTGATTVNFMTPAR